MKNKPQIQWQPISRLPLLAQMVDGMFQDDQKQSELFLQVRHKPHVLDDATVNRAIRAFETQLEDLTTLYEPQFARWQQENLTDAQKQELNRLTTKLADVKKLVENILTLLNEIKNGTIDKIMAKSDAELALEVLIGKRKPPVT